MTTKQEKKKAKRKIYHESIRELGPNFSILGIARIFQDCWLLKFYWIFWTIVAITLFGLSVGYFIRDYLQFNTLSNIDIYSEISSPFPQVSFCHVNSISKPSAVEYFEKNFPDISINSIDNNDSDSAILTDSKLQSLKYSYLFNTKLFLEDERVQDLLTYPLNELLISCIYNYKPCYLSDFTPFYNLLYGKCYQFNPKERLARSGSLNGLKLEIFLGLPEQKYSLEKGLHIFINNKTSVPDPSSGFDVKAGQKTSIDISTRFDERLPLPYNDCYKNGMRHESKLVDIINKGNYTYKQIDCQKLCSQVVTIEQCSCYNVYRDKLNGTRPCTTLSDTECENKVFANWSTLFEEQNFCGPELCPVECDLILYEISSSSSNLSPSNYYLNNIIQNSFIGQKYPSITTKQLSENLLELNFYKSKLQYTKITQTAQYSFTDFISSFGGNLGLFLGASLFTLVEIIEIIYKICCISRQIFRV